MRSFVRTALWLLCAAIASPALALTRGQMDTFAANAENWFAGAGPGGGVPPLPPVREPGGGPAGAADSFLQITSIGSNVPGGRLVAMNATQWAGDYLAAGIDAIEMDVRNLGTADLTLRLLFEDPAGGAPLNVAATSGGIFLPAGSGWMRARFEIAPAALLAISGDPGAALSGTTLLRIFHSTQQPPDPLFPGEPIAAVLGIDNVTAVPEPASVILLLAGLAVVGARRWQARS